MAQEILGVDLLIYSDNEVMAGQRDATLNISGDQIDTTTKDNGNFKTSATGLLSWSVNTTMIELKGQKAKSQVAFMKAMLNRELVNVKGIQKGKLVFSGLATITAKDTSAPYGDVTTGSYTLNGASALDIDYVPFISSVSASTTTVTITLTETDAAVNGSAVLKDCIKVGNVNPTNATMSNGVITATMAAAPSSGAKVIILADTLKSGSAVQTEELEEVLA
jgi:TP901-1 family phage major tail protein